MKVFITGASGLVGSQIVKLLLSQGYHIIAIRRRNSVLNLLNDVKDKIVWHEADLFDTEILYDIASTVDYIIHCAGVISEGDIDTMYKVNLEGTTNIVNVALESNVKKLIHISSVSALGKTKDGSLISESTKWKDGPQNSKYGESKMLGEIEVWRGIAEGLSAVILNPSVVLGVGDGKTGSSVILPLLAKGPQKFLPGATGFVDVVDVARITLLAIESEVENERFIVNGHNKSFRTLMTDASVRLDTRPPTSPLGNGALNFMCTIDAIASFFLWRDRKLTKTMVMQATRSLSYDNSKSKSAFNFEYTDWEETLDRICETYKS
jgi:nucleoside-diphosphate-sugar epimerase